MKKIITIFLIIFLSSLNLFSQEEKIDSLLNIIPTLEGEKKIDDINLVSTLYWRLDKNISLKYAKTALELSTEIEYQHGIANALSNLGILALYDNDNKKAILYLTKALNRYKELNDTSNITKLHINLSDFHPDFLL